MAFPDFDCYEVLEVHRTARPEVIKAAYKILVKAYHPDHNPGADQAMIKRLNVAYELLTDDAQRAEYDSLTGPGERGAGRTDGGADAKRQRTGNSSTRSASAGGPLKCTRCGQRFKTRGGLEWHTVNRPKCDRGG